MTMGTHTKPGTATTADDAWTEGYDAFLAGKSETSNPYEPNDDKHLSWNDGFDAAEAEDECA